MRDAIDFVNSNSNITYQQAVCPQAAQATEIDTGTFSASGSACNAYTQWNALKELTSTIKDNSERRTYDRLKRDIPQAKEKYHHKHMVKPLVRELADFTFRNLYTW